MKALKGFWVILSLVSILVSFARAASLSERVAPEPEPSLHVLLLDACLLPEDLDFFRGKHLRVEFITSAKPALKRVFNSEICMSHYRRAVGDAGAVVEFHSNFLGTKMASHQEVIRVVDRIVKKRGPLDFVVANNSDQAAYIASFVRAHLGQQTPWQNVPKPENFYDKYQMKTNLRKNAPDIRTADFVALDASEIELNQFLQRADFPQQPIILKKRRSAGSVGILVMHSMKDYIAMKKKVKDKHNYLIEKFIRGRVFRVAGERIDHKLKFVIPSINFTSPYEHYKLAKPRATTSIDDTIVAGKDFYQFTDKVLDALEMVSGTFHLEGILSDQDDELYFMEIALRVGEGNMDAPHREVFGYHAKRAYFFKQFPQGYFSEEDEQHYVEELFEQPRQSSQKAFAVITFPFLDSNKYTFQKIRTNMDAQLSQGHPRYPSLVSCDFEENLLKIPPHKLDSKQGAVLTRYAYQACLKAVACRFEGSRSEIDADLDAFQREFYFIAQPAHPKLNAFVPRAFLAAGGL